MPDGGDKFFLPYLAWKAPSFRANFYPQAASSSKLSYISVIPESRLEASPYVFGAWRRIILPIKITSKYCYGYHCLLYRYVFLPFEKWLESFEFL